MTRPAGSNLFHRKAKPWPGVWRRYRFEYRLSNGDALAWRKAFERAFQQAGLSRARRTDQIQAKDVCSAKRARNSAAMRAFSFNTLRSSGTRSIFNLQVGEFQFVAFDKS